MKENYDAPVSEFIHLLSDDIMVDSLPFAPMGGDDEEEEF